MTPIETAISALAEAPSEHLQQDVLQEVARQIMDGEADPSQISAFLMGLRMVGERGEDVVTFVQVMLEHATPLPNPGLGDKPILDTCGTGGDGLHTFNVSTAAALLVAACGVHVAKHGNRSASSKCGSADVLEEAGVPLELSPEAAVESLRDHKFCFLFAPAYHPSMRHAGPARRAMKIRTLFNLCGPLANPLRPTHQIVGVPKRDLIRPVAEGLKLLGRRGALVVRGDEGMDEISLCGRTEGLHLDETGAIHGWEFNPYDVGLDPVPPEALVGGDKVRNAEILREVLGGEASAFANASCINAGAALWLAGEAPTVAIGIEQARDAQRHGKGLPLLETLIGGGSA